MVIENLIYTSLLLALIGDTKSFLVLFSDSCTSRVLVMKTSLALILCFIAATVIGTCTAASGNGTRVKRSYDTEWDKPFTWECNQSEYFLGYFLESARVRLLFAPIVKYHEANEQGFANNFYDTKRVNKKCRKHFYWCFLYTHTRTFLAYGFYTRELWSIVTQTSDCASEWYDTLVRVRAKPYSRLLLEFLSRRLIIPLVSRRENWPYHILH